MKGKLIKRKDRWDLYYDKDISMINTIASSEDNPKGKLCLKNCEEIERGYNLDELIEESYEKHRVNDKDYSINEQIQRSGGFSIGYEEGFKKALEILSDNEFSENDVRTAYHIGKVSKGTSPYSLGKQASDFLVESLKKTEWDVEICCYVDNSDGWLDADSFNFPLCTNTGIPKLDENECLILRRI